MRKNSEKDPLLYINGSFHNQLNSLLSMKSFGTVFQIERIKIKLGRRQLIENFYLKKILKTKIENSRKILLLIFID